MSEEPETKPKLLKIMFIGDTNVGKSMFIKRYVTGEFMEKFIPTVGIDFMKKSVEYGGDDGKPKVNLTLELWDTAGQERYQSMTQAYYRSARAFVVVFDLGRQDSFTKVDMWLDTIKDSANEPDIKIILCGNKLDLEEREVEEETARKKAETLGFEYFETSAKTGANIEEAMEALTDMLMDNYNPDGDTDEEEVDEEALKKEVEEKVKLSEEGEAGDKVEGKKPSKCAC